MRHSMLLRLFVLLGILIGFLLLSLWVFGDLLVDLPVSDDDEEEFEDEMDDGEEGGGGSSKKKAKQHVEQLKRLQQKVRPLSPAVSSPLNWVEYKFCNPLLLLLFLKNDCLAV